jgi:hypothetical protein
MTAKELQKLNQKRRKGASIYLWWKKLSMKEEVDMMTLKTWRLVAMEMENATPTTRILCIHWK